MTTPTAAALAGIIDHTLLTPEATAADVADLVSQARRFGTWSVCISPAMLPLSGVELGGVRLATVCGFPSGKHTPDVKAREAAESVALDADEVDMVINLGLLRAGRVTDLTAEIATVRAAVPAPHLLKVIIESAVLSDEEIVTACHCAEEAGADFVKTSTGFHKAGGASVHAVELMAATVGGRLGVKASGGIRDYETACAMIDAGATRLGVSATASILAGAR
ncbi:deoxyribose-phosphate aldolase [Acidipropionibacterium virtanenii]|uniref:Deoxyribose-phosphate aldolase n=1 Tax=Acidipropionibacterium virtanenii TaxID=2057246 RepID=A0A344UWV8_9ACTN|nr:deoxyribose-phosphate aldolase [Acidipropionibacterium virtanenii]AXE39756.1 Deoxyribose-phosphate aldolase [Acidipropionibacterium virtanenii]